MYETKVGWCPHCGQGWQVILKDVRGTLYVTCEECLLWWESPAALGASQSCGLDIPERKPGEKPDPSKFSTVPTRAEIAAAGWDRYLLTD